MFDLSFLKIFPALSNVMFVSGKKSFGFYPQEKMKVRIETAREELSHLNTFDYGP